MNGLNFRTNSKLKSLVGQELITNNNIAIFELIKNSYDAAATEVEIRFNNFEKDLKGNWISNKDSSIMIIDNGKGMTPEEVDKYWMELGKSSKENNKIIRMNSDKLNKIIERFSNGEKGIGRFGVDKIGSQLVLESIGEGDNDKITVYFDWNKYEDRTKLLQEIKNEYKIEKKTSAEYSGLTLEIKMLRDTWGVTEIGNLMKNISKFLSPNRLENEDFRIFISFYNGGVKQDRSEIENDSFSYLNCKIKAILSKNGICEFIISNKNGDTYNEKNILFPEGSPLGKVVTEIYYLDKGDKNYFTRKMGLRTSDYGNIKVFRDNFRVMPYGEPHNDWLEIDKEHAQGIFRTLGTRDLVGNIFLNGEDMNGQNIFKEATDRVGLIEDAPEFEKLKYFEWKVIKKFENFIFMKIKEDAKEATEIVKFETNELRKETSKSFESLKNIIKNVDVNIDEKKEIISNFEKSTSNIINKIENIEKANNEIDRKIKIYSQMTNKEGILFEMLHSVRNKLAIIEGEIHGFEREIRVKNVDIDTNVFRSTYDYINKLINGALDRVNASKLVKARFNILELMNDIFNNYSENLIAKGITLRTNIDEHYNAIMIKGVRESLLTVFENLFSNSFKALSTIEDPKIEITIKINGKNIEIYFSDNGIGVPDDKKRSLFTLWSSETNGTGIGLASSREIVEDHNGEIYYVDLSSEDFVTTFMIKLPMGDS